MKISLNIKRGLNLKVVGEPRFTDQKSIRYITPRYVAVTPDDFPGLTLKPVVKVGDEVAEGSPLMTDKHDTYINIVSPVAGKVADVVRGDRRKLIRIVIESNGTDTKITPFDVSRLNANKTREILQQSGLWSMIRQRPYNIVARNDAEPRDIFVSLFDSAPLAPDMERLLADRVNELEAGVKALSALTSGDIYVARRHDSIIGDIAGATIIDVSGPHPAGNTGIIAANVKPVNKGETIWTLDGMTLARIGRLFTDGTIDTDCYVAITGSEVADPGYIKTRIGAQISELTAGRLTDATKHVRIISGNMLTGVAVKTDDFLRYPYTQITVIPEGDDVEEFMGWATLSPKKMSTSRSFPGHFLRKLFKPDARLLGGRRAMIMSGEYDKVVPMDIMTEYLIKAILSKDIEKMEALGIYEVAPEDFALAEYVCTSKMPLQSIVAAGLDYMRKELE